MPFQPGQDRINVSSVIDEAAEVSGIDGAKQHYEDLARLASLSQAHR
jgi:hypothetical protein